MTNTDDAAVIEEEIRETQNEMSSTIDRIGEQLSAKNLFNALLDRAEENNIDARMLLDGARRNPVALGLIAAGAIWLVSDKDAKLPSMPAKSDKPKSKRWSIARSSHSDYLSHMAEIEQQHDEDADAFQQRHDAARSSFFNVERNSDEDEPSFRSRLDGMTETLRQKSKNWTGSLTSSTAQVRDATKDKMMNATNKSKDLYSANPLIGGLIAAAVGAAIGSTIPVSRKERETLGPLGEKARNAVGEKAREATDKLRERKDEVVQKAHEAIKPAGNDSSSDQTADQMQTATA